MKLIKKLEELNIGESGTLYLNERIYYIQRLCDNKKHLEGWKMKYKSIPFKDLEKGEKFIFFPKIDFQIRNIIIIFILIIVLIILLKNI